jgi:hypothetical protein
MTEPDAAVTPYDPPAVTVPGKTADFTIRRDPHTFTIDDDTFKAPSLLSSVALTRVVDVLMELGSIDGLGRDPSKIKPGLEAVGRAMKILLPGASGRRFLERLNSDPEQVDDETGEPVTPPIDLLRQAIPAMMFLLECYGLRPTRPSSSSSNGSTDGNTPNVDASSMAGVSLPVSESMDLTPPNSST